MAKRKSKLEKMKEARIQRAIVGFRIPMMSLPKLYASLEQAAESDWTDAEMKSLVATFPGVEAI